MHTLPSVSDLLPEQTLVPQMAVEASEDVETGPGTLPEGEASDAFAHANNSSNEQAFLSAAVFLSEMPYGAPEDHIMRSSEEAEMEVPVTVTDLDNLELVDIDEEQEEPAASLSNEPTQPMGLPEPEARVEDSFSSEHQPARLTVEEESSKDEELPVPSSSSSDDHATVVPGTQDDAQATDGICMLPPVQQASLSPAIRSILMPSSSITSMMCVASSAATTALAWVLCPPEMVQPLATVALYMITALLLALIASGMASLILPSKPGENRVPPAADETPSLMGPSLHMPLAAGDWSSEKAVGNPEFIGNQQSLASPLQFSQAAPQQVAAGVSPPYLSAHADKSDQMHSGDENSKPCDPVGQETATSTCEQEAKLSSTKAQQVARSPDSVDTGVGQQLAPFADATHSGFDKVSPRSVSMLGTSSPSTLDDLHGSS
jgi:hypothetical protein